MNAISLTHGRGPIDGDVFARIIKAIRSVGYITLTDVFAPDQVLELLQDIKSSHTTDFQVAGIGRDQDHRLNQFVRSDRIRWLNEMHKPIQFYLEWANELRLRINRELYLGLFDFECHYAHYPKGAFYKKHVDAFKGQSNRMLSSILYLNPAWQPADGGELVLYKPGGDEVLTTVLPTFGTMVLFLSEEFPHEVLPAGRSRYSLTGWYRINICNSVVLDLPG